MTANEDTSEPNDLLGWTNTSAGRLRLRADGIIQIEIKEGLEQTPRIAFDNLQAAYRVCESSRRPILLDLRVAKSLTAETRQVYTGPGMKKYFTCIAIVVQIDTLNRLMANIYLHVARLAIPAHIFTNFDDGILWLKKNQNL